MKKKILLIFALLSLVGCQINQGAPIESSAGALPITTNIATDEFSYLNSEEHDILVGYPADWAIKSTGTDVVIVRTPDQFPWGLNPPTSEPKYSVWTKGPYVDRSNIRWRIPQSAAEIAEKIAWTFTVSDSGEIIEPVTNIDIHGQDGATFTLNSRGDILYFIVYRVEYDKVAILDASGSPEDIDQMKSMLNALALTLKPLED